MDRMRTSAEASGNEPAAAAPLRVYTDPEIWDSSEDPCSLLLPFLGDPANLARRTHSPFLRYWQEAPGLFTLSTLDECDVAVLPFNWDRVRLGDQWIPRWNRHTERLARSFFDRVVGVAPSVVAFFGSERSHEPLNADGVRVFRRSLYRSRRTDADVLAPAFPSRDPLTEGFGGEVAIRPKGEKPVVGFCGFARGKTFAERAKEPAYHLFNLVRLGYADVSPYDGLELRHRCVHRLAEDPRIETCFLLRGESNFDHGARSDERVRRYEEFLGNMRDSDYVLCCRGSANFSFRLYETLACGRIPLFIDTDSVLPFENEIDWRSLCVWVGEHEIDRIGERVAEFHARLSPEAFEALQLRCRDVYENWLSPHGFFRNFHRLLG